MIDNIIMLVQHGRLPALQSRRSLLPKCDSISKMFSASYPMNPLESTTGVIQMQSKPMPCTKPRSVKLGKGGQKYDKAYCHCIIVIIRVIRVCPHCRFAAKVTCNRACFAPQYSPGDLCCHWGYPRSSRRQCCSSNQRPSRNRLCWRPA